ncbi:hypothetical protein PoB_006522900 [Plakobranchus ocellatus]|uniref:Uncharacterized protein n=1 Tax=Plakobranchus ocellatus TaxID=259542 RepID=A0AAV4D3H3_9GAST|nr:hypothetical protein PoB_006522900 [Plakobranchus ocellatus]
MDVPKSRWDSVKMSESILTMSMYLYSVCTLRYQQKGLYYELPWTLSHYDLRLRKFSVCCEKHASSLETRPAQTWMFAAAASPRQLPSQANTTS